MTKHNAMSLNLKLLHVAGIVAPPNIKVSFFKTALYQLYIACCYLVYIPVLSGQILALYHFWGDIEITTNNIFTLLGAFTCFVEATYARFNTRNIAQLFETFQNKLVPKMSTVGLTEKKEEIFHSASKKARLNTLIVMIILDLMVAAWAPAPFIKQLMEESKNVTNTETEADRKWLNFCYIIWFPIDITVSPYFEIMYLIECIVFIIGTTYLKAVEMTIAAMMVHISAQFAILCTALEDVDKITSVSEEKMYSDTRKLFGRETTSLEGTDDPEVIVLGSQEWKVIQTRRAIDCNTVDMDLQHNERKNEDFPELTCYLANFVQYHQAVIEFVADVDKAVGPIFLVCFFIRQFLACVMSFQVALTWGQDNNILKFIFGFLGSMCSPAIFCWYGTAIIQSSLELQRAAYECKWYQHSQILKHYMLMIIARSQKPVRLSACQFYVISLHTFGKMINTIYAYFTLLKNQYEN